ncbi:MAG TPA: TIGR00730 family Rossman fold protein [Puia sp.]|nr:TIGR00730 family Rossman fold protein [Puia sp.]
MTTRSIVVFCGSQKGKNDLYFQHARELGRLLALLKVELIYGGGSKGLMGVLADSMLENGGKVIGIIPELLTEREHQHKRLTELAVVPDMHSRKKMLYDRGDVAIIMPGGFGTLDELFEMLTWNQLRLHDKKIFILNSGGFYTHLYRHLQHAQREGFLYDDLETRVLFCDTPADIFNRLP